MVTATAPSRRAQLRDVLLDPPKFSAGILRHKLWKTPIHILRSVRDNEQTAVKACHASSKTFTAAEAVLWWITRYDDGVAITTAPTGRQVRKLLWGEIHKALTTSRIQYPEPLQTELRLGPDRYAFGFATDEGVNFQGFHGRILIVLDEAMGILPGIWEAIEGIRAGGTVHVLALGNPTEAAGEFYEAFDENRKDWHRFTISAFDTPNFEDEENPGTQLTLEKFLKLPEHRLDYAPWPMLIKRRWVMGRIQKWGIDHPLFEARVLGRFPKQSRHALISLTYLEIAENDEPIINPTARVRAGIDVAGPGEDETVLTLVDPANGSILYQEAWPHQDPRGEVVAALAPVRNRLEVVNVDSAGMGWYFYLHLKDLGFPAVPVNVGEKASKDELDPHQPFGNLKAELYWQLRETFQSGVKGLTDEETLSQLAQIRWRIDGKGVTWIESKEEMRTRGVASPDRAESVMLAFARAPVPEGANEEEAAVW